MCHGPFDWIYPKIYSKRVIGERLEMQETLEIKKVKFNKKIKVLNKDEDNLVKTNSLTPLFASMNEM